MEDVISEFPLQNRQDQLHYSEVGVDVEAKSLSAQMALNEVEEIVAKLKKKKIEKEDESEDSPVDVVDTRVSVKDTFQTESRVIRVEQIAVKTETGVQNAVGNIEVADVDEEILAEIGDILIQIKELTDPIMASNLSEKAMRLVDSLITQAHMDARKEEVHGETAIGQEMVMERGIQGDVYNAEVSADIVEKQNDTLLQDLAEHARKFGEHLVNMLHYLSPEVPTRSEN